MAAQSWTEADDTQLRALAAAGTSHRHIAAQMGRTKSAITRRLHTLELGINRDGTVNATTAAVIDAKARRARLELLLLEDAEKLRSQVWEPHEYIDHGGKEFVEVRWTQQQPSPTDKLRLMQAATQAVDRSLRISEHDADAGLDQAVGMLDQIAAAIAAAGTTEPEQKG